MSTTAHRIPDATLDEAAERWKRGVLASAPFTRARAEAQRAVMLRNRANPRALCGIKDCDRHAYKGSLCRKHYALVPYSARAQAMVDSIEAQKAAAAKAHRKQLELVRGLLAEEELLGNVEGDPEGSPVEHDARRQCTA